jgi:leucyl-tRNA synthetase
MKYDHASIEKKWQKRWKEEGVYRTPDALSNDKKAYILDMFPYPSGQGLHVGHPKGYIATDIIARKKMMEGYDVLHPMGWDAFGLPAENYALKTKTHPKESTDANVARYKEQLSIIGLSYDWEREINTTDPAYYKWTQWAFLKMFERGLAYESDEPINWCPSCKTGLANEDLEGTACERCGTETEKKSMRQWVLRITDYADRLLEDLENLDWPESIKESQRNWIGKSVGTEIDFPLETLDGKRLKSLTVFTTRADTLFGCTYAVVAPEHKLLKNEKRNMKNAEEVATYVASARKKTDIERTAEGKEKTGVKIEGIEAINPANSKRIPVFVADYVLGDYGSGAVMAVPAHDERDFAFATKYNLPINDVVIPDIVDVKNPPREGKETVPRTAIHGIVHDPKTDKYLCLEWPKQNWTTFVTGGVDEGEDLSEAARREIIEETGYTNIEFVRSLGSAVRNQFFAAHKDENRLAFVHAMLFRLVDNTQEKVAEEERAQHTPTWLSWEEIKERENLACAEFPIWERRKDGRIPFVSDGWVVDGGEFSHMTSAEARTAITKWLEEKGVGRKKTTYKLRDWVFSRQRYWGEPIPIVHCEKCGAVAIPESELPLTLPEVESYEPTDTGESPLASMSKWINTMCPKCGGKAKRETNTMPQWAGSSWYYLRFMDPHNDTALVDSEKEKYWSPVDIYVGGAEHATRHLIYARFWHKFLHDIGAVSESEPFSRLQHVGLIGGEDGRKMSKRFGNVINPDDIVNTYGADTLRVYEMFMGAFDQNTQWSTENIMGARRFVERVWKLAEKVSDEAPELPKKTETLLHKTIQKVGEDIDAFGFNTAISALMILVNALEEESTLPKKTYLTFLSLAAPFIPHSAEEIHEHLGEEGSMVNTPWPSYDESKLADETLTIAVQVNGKLRGTFETHANTTQNELETKAKELPEIQKHIENKEVVKVITVPGKLVNIVIRT